MHGSEEKLVQKISARRVILTSFAVDLLDIVLNSTVALLSGSIIMLAQVFEAIADLTSSGLLLIGIQRSMKKEDKTHPFGYGREVYFWALLSAVVMFGLTSTLSFYLGWERFHSPKPISNTALALGVLILTFFTNFYAFFLSLRRLLRKRNIRQIIQIFYRSSLVETKTTFILDLMGTTASFFGALALFIYFISGDLRFDGLGAMVIGVTLGIFSISLISGIRDLVVGKSASKETEKRIIDAALEIEEVKGVLDIKTLHVGPEKLLVNLDVHMVSHLSTKALEKLIDEIKENIKKRVPSVKYLQVELETPR